MIEGQAKWLVAGLSAIASAVGLFLWQAPARIAVVETKVEALKDDQVYIRNTVTNVTEKIDKVLLNQQATRGPS